MRRINGWKLIGIIGLTAVSGCMMPAYRFPAGFSSTFQRHLYTGDPRAVPHQLPQNSVEGNGLRRLPGPSDEVIPPEEEQPQLDLPGLPIDPETHPTPPAPLPEHEAESPAQPPGEESVNTASFQRDRRKALANTAIALPRR